MKYFEFGKGSDPLAVILHGGGISNPAQKYIGG